MRQVRNRRGWMADNPMNRPQGGLAKMESIPYFPPADTSVDCIVCGNTYPLNTMSKSHKGKVCRFCAKHVHPDNVGRYQRGGKHNRYN